MKQFRVNPAAIAKAAATAAVAATTPASAFSTSDIGSSLRRHLTGQATPSPNSARRACGSPSAAAASMSARVHVNVTALNGNGHHSHHDTPQQHGSIMGATTSGGNYVSHMSSSSAETMMLLRQEVEMLRDELARRDAVIADLRDRISSSNLTPATAAAAPSLYPEGATVVATTTEFENAVARHIDIIAVAAGSHVRAPAGVSVDPGQTVTIVGPTGCVPADRPVIESHMLAKGAGAKLVLRNVEVRAASRPEPTISLGTCAHADIENVTLSNGRDGVYLSGKATANLTDCRITGNTRGVFEMQRCHATLARCAFEDNLFHCVLLAAPQAVMAQKCCRVQEDALGAGNTFSGGRCDVALAYNPMEDRYGQTYRGPQTITLSAADSTAGLVDEAW